MNSLAKHDFAVIDFLVRHFAERFTVRQMSQQLKLSAAGAHLSLKKLQKAGIVEAEKLGTGLFYQIYLRSKIAEHLAAIVLLDKDAKLIPVDALKEDVKALVYDNKTLLVIANNKQLVEDIAKKSLNDVHWLILNDEEFSRYVLEKDTKVLNIIQHGRVLQGEQVIVHGIKRYLRYG